MKLPQSYKIFAIIINNTYGADASVLVKMNTESAQKTCMHCYKFQNTYNVQTPHVIVCKFTSVTALALTTIWKT